MNVRKNAEAIFLALAVGATWAAYATAETPVVRAVAAKPAAVVVDNNMHVVVVKAKRLTAEEKAALN